MLKLILRLGAFLFGHFAFMRKLMLGAAAWAACFAGLFAAAGYIFGAKYGMPKFMRCE